MTEPITDEELHLLRAIRFQNCMDGLDVGDLNLGGEDDKNIADVLDRAEARIRADQERIAELEAREPYWVMIEDINAHEDTRRLIGTAAVDGRVAYLLAPKTFPQHTIEAGQAFIRASLQSGEG